MERSPSTLARSSPEGPPRCHRAHELSARAADLVETLYRGLADNSVGKIIDTLLRNDLVILDEVGFAPLDYHPSVIRKSEMGAENRRECGNARCLIAPGVPSLPL